jgi:hypothetical protein
MNNESKIMIKMFYSEDYDVIGSGFFSSYTKFKNTNNWNLKVFYASIGHFLVD